MNPGKEENMKILYMILFLTLTINIYPMTIENMYQEPTAPGNPHNLPYPEISVGEGNWSFRNHKNQQKTDQKKILNSIEKCKAKWWLITKNMKESCIKNEYNK